MWSPALPRNLIANGEFHLGEHADRHVTEAWCAKGRGAVHSPGWETLAAFDNTIFGGHGGGLGVKVALESDGWSAGLSLVSPSASGKAASFWRSVQTTGVPWSRFHGIEQKVSRLGQRADRKSENRDSCLGSHV